MKVLIVDDEPIVRRSLMRAFKSKGHDATEAVDGVLGLEAWREGSPDLVLLDVLMPRMTGPQMLEKMTGRTCKVILMSAYSGDYDMEKAKALGADVFVAKPFSDVFEIVQLGEEILAMKNKKKTKSAADGENKIK